MIERLRLLCAGLALALLAACSGDAWDDAASAPPASPLLYEIAGEDGTLKGWLFGTIHALPEGTRWRSPAIERAIAGADVLLVEIADPADEAGLAGTFTRLATTPGLPALPERVAPALRGEVIEMMDEAGLSARESEALETWAAALMLARLQRDGEAANGVDRAVIADFEGRRVHELEGAAAQLSIFANLPEAEQRDLLREVVAGAGSAGADPAALRRAWLEGDEAALVEASATGILADPELREALLTNRNSAWMSPILAELERGTRPLVAVGAAHVVGPEGLAALIEAEGYTLRPLR